MMKSLRYYIQNVSGIIKLSNQYIMHIYIRAPIKSTVAKCTVICSKGTNK